MFKCANLSIIVVSYIFIQRVSRVLNGVLSLEVKLRIDTKEEEEEVFRRFAQEPENWITLDPKSCLFQSSPFSKLLLSILTTKRSCNGIQTTRSLVGFFDNPNNHGAAVVATQNPRNLS